MKESKKKLNIRISSQKIWNVLNFKIPYGIQKQILIFLYLCILLCSLLRSFFFFFIPFFLLFLISLLLAFDIFYLLCNWKRKIPKKERNKKLCHVISDKQKAKKICKPIYINIEWFTWDFPLALLKDSLLLSKHKKKPKLNHSLYSETKISKCKVKKIWCDCFTII